MSNPRVHLLDRSTIVPRTVARICDGAGYNRIIFERGDTTHLTDDPDHPNLCRNCIRKAASQPWRRRWS